MRHVQQIPLRKYVRGPSYVAAQELLVVRETFE